MLPENGGGGVGMGMEVGGAGESAREWGRVGVGGRECYQGMGVGGGGEESAREWGWVGMGGGERYQGMDYH